VAACVADDAPIASRAAHGSADGSANADL